MTTPPGSAPGRSRQRAVAVIPARLGSQRLERKMLLAETGRALFAHTAANALETGVFERVVVATDSEEIAASAAAEGVEAVMTRTDHRSGTDRVREAVERIGAEDADVVVNVQGDEPELARDDLARLVTGFERTEVQIGTLAGELGSPEELRDSSVVKVVCAADGRALYFSRAAIPDASHARAESPAKSRSAAVARRHIGVYGFRPAALTRFCDLAPGRLEALENLEQLRWLEAGEALWVFEASHVPHGIDTRKDYDEFVARLRARESLGP